MNRYKFILLLLFKMRRSLFAFSIIGLLSFLSLFFYLNLSEKKDEVVFLENVMIREGGLYVLMGSKPMVSFYIRSGIPETEEEYQKHVENIKTKYPKDEFESYEEFKVSHKADKYSYYGRLWQNWETKMQDYVGPHFQFVTRKAPFGDILEGLFINNCSLLYVLTAHSSEFERAFGASFDPKKVLNEISDPDSVFWDIIFRNQYTQGLLFGYGPRNSFNFEWQIEKDFPFPIREFQDIFPLVKKKIRVSDLRLPTISQYFLGDPVLESYKLQRKEILAEFKNKDFETVVKKWLRVGIAPKE